jgi:hypothetical protein
MPREQNRAQVPPCPFTAQKIIQQQEIKKLDYYTLPFSTFSMSTGQTRVKKYTFGPATKGQSGVFMFREPGSNKILACGSTTRSLQDVIWKSIARYRIKPNALLVVIQTPACLATKTLNHLKETYKAKPVESTYKIMLPFLTKSEQLPIDEIQFHPLFSKYRSVRHKSRTKTSFGYLHNRPGLYFIKEREKGSVPWDIVYVGKAKTSLLDRIYTHFLPSQLYTGNVCYYDKLQTHEYEIGIIEIPRETACIKTYDKNLLSYENSFIRQIDPRDNRRGKIQKEILSNEENWFDNLPEVENEFTVLEKIRF